MASRTAILRGPAIIQFNSVDFFSKGDIEVEIDEESFEIIASAYGKVDERLANRIAKVRFEPVGEWESLATLYPYPATVVGASIFTGTDKPLVIQTLDGRAITFQAAALTKMPDLTLSAVKTAFGQLEFTCIGKDNTAWSTASSFVAISSVSMPASTFDPANVKSAPWTGVWGATPWDGFQTKDGFQVSFDLKLGRLDTDTDGLVDMMFESLGVMVKCQPVVSTGSVPGGITEQNIIDALALQGVAGAVRGKSYQAFANNADLALTATGQTFTLKKAAMKGAGFKFGATTVRVGDAAWVATRALTTGVIQPLFAIS